MSLTGRPSRPPLALTSSSQIFIATSDILPLAASGPVRSQACADCVHLSALLPPQDEDYRADQDFPHTSSESSAIIASFAHCSSSARIFPSSVEAKPHCGDRQNCSSGANFAASSMRRLMSAFFSSVPLFDVTRPSTTILLPLGRKRSGSKPPARSVSYSRK